MKFYLIHESNKMNSRGHIIIPSKISGDDKHTKRSCCLCDKEYKYDEYKSVFDDWRRRIIRKEMMLLDHFLGTRDVCVRCAGRLSTDALRIVALLSF